MSEVWKTLVSLNESPRDPVTKSRDTCLTEDEILTFVKGQLGSDCTDRIHAHLDCCSMCQRVTVEAAHALDAEPVSNSARPSWNTVFQPGAMIANRYCIEDKLGQGGMGEVFSAYDTRLQERVAIKTVTSTLCDNPEVVRLLKAEVQLARRISHPNVCRIFDLGTHCAQPSGSEISFLVMEYVKGQCLGKKLRQLGALRLDAALSIAKQLLLGLRAAHISGILHRDFKSDNVMIQYKRGGRVKAVILDFGLATLLSETGSVITTHSQQVETMIGTVAYMAPEQIEGRPLTVASDIYAFGVVLFEMLTGRLPFEADTPAALAMSRLHRAPRPPSRYNPKVPDWADKIVLKCLGRHPSDRFASTDQVMLALAAHAEDSLKRTHRSRRKTQVRRRFVALAVTLVALPVVVAAGYTNATRPNGGLARQANAQRLPTSVAESAPPVQDLTSDSLQDGNGRIEVATRPEPKVIRAPASANPAPSATSKPQEIEPAEALKAPPDWEGMDAGNVPN